MSRRRRNSISRVWLLAGLVAVGLSGCAETRFMVHTAKRLDGSAESKQNGYYKVGTPYQVDGIWYYPKQDYGYDETGIASWYGAEFHGRPTANGEVYDMNALTAAHKTLPMPSFVRVTNLENGRSMVLRINDRGPFVHGRIIDLSRRSAQLLGMQDQGTAKVRVQILADRSRAIAARMQGGVELARVGSPITVDRLPKESVSQESLPPPDGADVAPERVTAASPTPPPAEDRASATEIARVEPSRPEPEIVTEEVVDPTNIFIQTGAFTVYQNALRMQAALSPVAEAFIQHELIDEQDFYRVRIGPIGTVAEADRLLERVSRAGYPGSRVIVD